MCRQTVLKSIGIPLLVLAGLVLIAWFAFVPSAKEPGYQFVASWGQQGSAPGQFHDPTGIAIQANEVFVADARNGRIQVFDRDGNLLRVFGEPG